MRWLRNLLYFCVGLLLGAIGTLAKAETIAATYGYPSGYTTLTSSPTWATMPDGIAIYGTVLYEKYGSKTHGCVTSYPSDWSFWGGYFASNAYSCGFGVILAKAAVQEYSCPAGQNWTLSGSSCTRPDCSAGETRLADGTCKVVCSAAGTPATSALRGTYTGAGVGIPSSLCINGCSYATGGLSIGTGTLWAAELGSSLGSNCSGGNTGTQLSTTDPAYKCVSQGKGYGTVNGVVVCTGATTVTSNSSSNKSSTTRTTDTSNNTTTTTNGETSESTTTCEGDKCTTTSTKTTINADGSKSQVTAVTTSDKGSFCSTNPTAPACTGATESDKYCIDNPQSLMCQKASFTNPTKGSFESKSQAVTEAETALSQQLEIIKAQAKILVGQLGTGVGTLPCPEGIQVAGSTFKLCARDFQEKLSPIPAAMMVIAAFASLIIIFR